MVFLDLLPHIGRSQAPAEQEYFKFYYRFVLNMIFLAMSAVMVWLWRWGRKGDHGEHGHGGSVSLPDKVLRALSALSIVWLAGGLTVALFI